MADSELWGNLHDKFLAVQDRLRAASESTDLTYKQLEVLEKRGALAFAGVPDVWIWLEAVMKEDPAFCSSYLAKKVSSLAEFEQNLEIGTLDHMCQASATFCKKLEAKAVQAEFEERNSKDTILSRATAAVSGTLFQKVTGVCKSLFKIHYESREEIDEAPEWQELNKLFCDASDTYVNIAMGNRSEIRGDLFAWVREKIEADEKAISVQHFGCDANGYFVSGKTSLLPKHDDTWSAMEHLGWLTNFNAAWSTFNSHLSLAKSEALGNASIRIASGNTSHLQPASHDTSATRERLPVRPLPIRSFAPLSKFEATIGELMIRARKSCPTKYLPHAEILKIAAVLDNENFAIRDNLEREAARALAEYNQKHPTSATKNWRTALGLPQFRRAVRKRFSRAEEKYKKTTASVAPSAGTPRTAF